MTLKITPKEVQTVLDALTGRERWAYAKKNYFVSDECRSLRVKFLSYFQELNEVNMDEKIQ